MILVSWWLNSHSRIYLKSSGAERIFFAKLSAIGVEGMKDTVRRIFYRVGNLPISRLVARKYQGKILFLMYHRVIQDSDFINHTEPTEPLSELSISVSRFDEQISYISKSCQPISIDQLPSLLSDTNSLSNIPVVVTFDDGYKDNLVYALPILKKHKVPAVIYITTCFPEGDCSIWWFELWENYQEYVLNWEEIKELDKEELITIGAHTHTHPNLRNLNESTVIKEMITSKELLEKNLGHSVEHFAYPYGTPYEAGQREYGIAKNVVSRQQ